MSLREEESNPIPIPGCVKSSYHMICFEPNGTIITKVNLCSCIECLEGNFLHCSIEKGNTVCGGDDDEVVTDVRWSTKTSFAMKFLITTVNDTRCAVSYR